MTDTTYILTVTAMPGHGEDVARFFRDLEPALKDAKGSVTEISVLSKTAPLISFIAS